MRIKFNKTPEQIELVKQMASKNKLEAIEAREAFAALITSPVNQVLNKLGTTNSIFEPFTFNEDDNPEIPLDPYYDKNTDYVQVWQSSDGSSAPTSETTGLKTLKLSWTGIESAFSVNERYAQRSQLDVIALHLNRMLQEMLRKKEILGWTVIMKALGQAVTNGNDHIIQSTTENQLQVDDFNRWLTFFKRLNVSWDAGTPDAPYTTGATDLYLSPEMMQEIRGMAYQPQNTRATPDTAESTVLGLPDAVREEIYRNAGLTEFYGKTLHELNELGVGYAYTHFFGSYAPANSGPGGNTSFDATTDEILCGIDLSRGTLISPVATFDNDGTTAVVETDDLFAAKRIRKMGWYARQQIGFACLDARSLSGLVV